MIAMVMRSSPRSHSTLKCLGNEFDAKDLSQKVGFLPQRRIVTDTVSLSTEHIFKNVRKSRKIALDSERLQ